MKVRQVFVSAALMLMNFTVPGAIAQDQDESLFAGDTSIAATIEEQAGGATRMVRPPQASAKGLRGYHNKPYWGKPSWKPYWNDWNTYYKKPYWNDHSWNKPSWGKPYWKPSWGYRGSRGVDRGNKNVWGDEPSSSSIDNGPPEAEGFGPPLDEEDGPEDEFDLGPPGGFGEDDPEGEFDFGPPPNQGGP